MEAKALCDRVNYPGYGYIDGMIESEMGYSAANPFTTHNLSFFYFIYDDATAVKSSL
jgi:hypothetical protein